MLCGGLMGRITADPFFCVLETNPALQSNYTSIVRGEAKGKGEKK